MQYLYILKRPHIEDVYALSLEALFPLIKDYTEKYISECTILRKNLVKIKND